MLVCQGVTHEERLAEAKVEEALGRLSPPARLERRGFWEVARLGSGGWVREHGVLLVILVFFCFFND